MIQNESQVWAFAGKPSHLRYVVIRMPADAHGYIRARFRRERLLHAQAPMFAQGGSPRRAIVCLRTLMVGIGYDGQI